MNVVDQLAQRVNDGELSFAEAYREFSEMRAEEAWQDLPVAERKRLEELEALAKRLKDEHLDTVTE